MGVASIGIAYEDSFRRVSAFVRSRNSRGDGDILMGLGLARESHGQSWGRGVSRSDGIVRSGRDGCGLFLDRDELEVNSCEQPAVTTTANNNRVSIVRSDPSSQPKTL